MKQAFLSTEIEVALSKHSNHGQSATDLGLVEIHCFFDKPLCHEGCVSSYLFSRDSLIWRT